MKHKIAPTVAVAGRKFAFLFFATALLSSCVKDNFDFEKVAEIKYNPNFAIPLVHSSLTMDDILLNVGESNGFIVEESDKSLTVVYKSTFASVDASALTEFGMPSPTANSLIIPVVPGTQNQTMVMPFVMTSGADVDSIGFKAGSLSFSFTGLTGSAQLTITIPTARDKNGVVFSQIVTLPTSNSVSYDLSGYTFGMTPTSNQFNINFSLNSTGGVGGTLSVSSGMNNLQFSKIFGDLKSVSLPSHKDTLDLTIFRNVLNSASFSLINPKAKVIIHNSFGIPMDINFMQLDGETPGTSSFPILNTTPFPINISSPNLSQVGQVLIDTTKLDNTNSQISTVVNNTPKHINYDISASSNTSSPSQNQFVLHNSHFDAEILMELPLHGRAAGFTLVDTIPFEIGQDVSDNIESGLIRLYNANGFPMDLNLQVYFADSSKTKLDSLMGSSQALLISGTVNSTTGRVVSSTENTIDVKIDKTRLQNLGKSKYIIVMASANTTNLGTVDVKIYSDYTLEVKLGVQLQLDAKVNPNQQ